MVARRGWLALVLCACGGGSSEPAPPDSRLADASPVADAAVDAPPDGPPVFQVVGTVVDADRNPVAGQTVIVVGTGETAVSDAAGQFTLPGVTAPPYDLAVWDPTAVSGGSASPAATIYVGLTRPDPSIMMFTSHPQHRYGTVVIDFPGGLPASHFEVLDTPELTFATCSAPASSIQCMTTWSGPTTTTGVLRSISQTQSGSVTTGFVGYGATPATTLNHTTTVQSTLTYGAAPSSGTISGAATFPAGNWTHVYQYVQFGAGVGLQQVLVTSGGAFSLLVPVLPGASHVICATASFDTGYAPPQSLHCAGDLAAGATGVTLETPAWSEPVSPATDAVAPRAGPFSWTAPAGGISVLHVAPQVIDNPHFWIITAAETATVPSLDASIPASPAGTLYGWRVYGYPEVATVDDAATGTFPRGTGQLGPPFVRPLWGPSIQVTKSQTRFFTTP